MPRNIRAGAFSALAFLAAAAAAQETPYSAASRGARCDLEADGTVTCRYVVGRDLEFSLRRVTRPDVRLDIVRSDPEGDYFVEPVLVSRCALVRFGRRGATPGSDYAVALVSGKNGMVYRRLRECRLSR